MKRAFAFRAAMWLLTGFMVAGIVRYLSWGNFWQAADAAMLAAPVVLVLFFAEENLVYGEFLKRDREIAELKHGIIADRLADDWLDEDEEDEEDEDEDESPTVAPQLRVLDDLCWAFECLAMDHTGEAKHALFVLREKLQVDPAYFFSGREQLLDVISRARSSLVAGERREATHDLSEASRSLWNSMQPQPASCIA